MEREPYEIIYALPTPAGILRLVGPKGPVALQMDDCTGESPQLDRTIELLIPIATLEAGESYTLQFSDAPKLAYEPTLIGGRYTSTSKNTRFGISITEYAKRNGNFELVGETEEPAYTLDWDVPHKGEVTVKINPYANPDPIIHIAVAWGDTSSAAKTRLDHFIGAATE